MVVAEQVQEPVGEVAIELGSDRSPLRPRAPGRGVEGHYHVAEERPSARRFRYREGQDVGRLVLASPLPVQRPDPPVGDEEHRELGVVEPQGREEGLGAGAEAAGGRRAPRVLGGEEDGHGRSTTSFTGGRSPSSRGLAG